MLKLASISIGTVGLLPEISCASKSPFPRKARLGSTTCTGTTVEMSNYDYFTAECGGACHSIASEMLILLYAVSLYKAVFLFFGNMFLKH